MCMYLGKKKLQPKKLTTPPNISQRMYMYYICNYIIQYESKKTGRK